MRYEVVIEVDDQAESAAFEAWLQQNQHEIIAISENSGCGCCVHIFTLEISDNAQPLPAFSKVDSSQVDLHYAIEKNRIIHNYLNHP